MEYCPYQVGSESHTSYSDANYIIESNPFNGRSNPNRVYEYIRDLSTGDSLEDCVQQWRVDAEIDVPDGYFCTCGHHIHYMYMMINTVTGYMLISGSDCINKFGNKRLRSEVSRARLKRYLESNMRIPLRMKYIKDVSNVRNTRYSFKIRKGTTFYKMISEFDTVDFTYCPWFFDRRGNCILTLIYKYPKSYIQDEWVDIHISMVEYEINSNRILSFYFRSSA